MKRILQYILVVLTISIGVALIDSPKSEAFIGSPKSSVLNGAFNTSNLFVHPLVNPGLNAKDYVTEVRKKKRKAHRKIKKGKRPAFKKHAKRHKKRKKWRKKARKRYWGAVVGGVVLGTAIGVATANSIPPRPSPELCWTWTNAPRTQGYWYYCVEP